MRSLADLLAEVRARHFPGPPASRAALDGLEQRIGCALPSDLRDFYLGMGGARLFSDPRYRILGPEDVRPVKLDVPGASELTLPEGWLSIGDVQDGNYVAIDLPAKPSGEVWFIDCFHETIGEPGGNEIIALSFAEFLERALGAGEMFYWLEDGFRGYGDALERAPG
jgi:cell wall assembly regulator SMI1